MAAFSCFRLMRALRSICAPITTVIGFSFLLTWIFILYQHDSGPGITQRVGWQSWEIVSLADAVDNASNNSKPSTDLGSPSPEGVDWWNVTATNEATDYSSLPLDVWSPLLPHDTGRAWNIFTSVIDRLKFYSI